jgi:hypothetical protein
MAVPACTEVVERLLSLTGAMRSSPNVWSMHCTFTARRLAARTAVARPTCARSTFNGVSLVPPPLPCLRSRRWRKSDRGYTDERESIRITHVTAHALTTRAHVSPHVFRMEELPTCNLLGPYDGRVVYDAHTWVSVSKWKLCCRVEQHPPYSADEPFPFCPGTGREGD